MTLLISSELLFQWKCILELFITLWDEAMIH